MAIEDYEVFISTDAGVRQFYIATLTRLEMTMITNGIGVVILEFPAVSDKGNRFSIDQFDKDYWIEVKRQDELQGGAPYLIRRKERLISSGGQTISLMGFHANHLLNRRNVAYYAGSTQATASTEACDDAIKRLVRDNLGADSDHADRDATPPDLSGLLTVDSDTSEAPDTTRGFSRQILYNVVLDFVADSYEQGTPLFFGFNLDEATRKLNFITKPHFWGDDRANDIILSPDYGNFENARQIWDWSNEITVAYALGSDTGTSRNIGIYQSAARNDSVFNWIERTQDARSMSDGDSLIAEARGLVREHQGQMFLEGEIVQKVGAMYQNPWRWGDRLPVSIEGVRQNVWVSSVTISVNDQDETITPELEVIQ